MRGCKLSVAIITIVIGVLGALGGIFMILWGALSWGAASNMERFGALVAFFGAMLVFVGIVALAFGALYLFLGIKFLSHKPNKGIAVTLLVLNILGSLSIFGFTWETTLVALPSIVCVILLIVYLVKLGKQNQQMQPYQDGQFPPPQNQ